MAYLQMELPMLIDVVMYIVFCVTVWLGGVCAVRIACGSIWRSSATLCSPQEHRWSIVLVISVPLSIMAFHVFGSRLIRVCICSSDVSSAFTSWLYCVCGSGSDSVGAC